MMTRSKPTLRSAARLALALLVLAASAVALEGPAAARAVNNGRVLNGRWLNGRWLNGVSLEGATLAGGSALPYVWTEGSQIVGSTPDWQRVQGTALIGARLRASTVDAQGNPLAENVVVRLDSAALGGGERADVWYYKATVEIRKNKFVCGPMGCYQTTQLISEPLCEPGVLAVAFSGTWDYRSGAPDAGGRANDEGLTLACVDAALGKCVDMGYSPWPVSQEVYGEYYTWDEQLGYVSVVGWHTELRYDLIKAHESCVRMVRGDYCGDGRAYTVDGTPIEVLDSFSPQINSDTRPNHGREEAVWGPDGAECMSASRHEELFSIACVCPLYDVNGLPFCPANPSAQERALMNRIKTTHSCELSAGRLQNQHRPDEFYVDDTAPGPGLP